MIKNVMSREIRVVDVRGNVSLHQLSIAAIEMGADNVVKDVTIIPFTREIPAVEYFDSPLTIEIGKPFDAR